jgi:hypothetical protein
MKKKTETENQDVKAHNTTQFILNAGYTLGSVPVVCYVDRVVDHVKQRISLL